MGTRLQSVTPFHASQGPSTEHAPAAEKVKVNFKLAQRRNIGQSDALAQSLVSPPRNLMDTQHFSKRPPDPKGHAYRPHWEALRGRSGISGTKPTGMSPHRSAPGSNALGRMMNRVGEKVGAPFFKPRGGGKKP